MKKLKNILRETRHSYSDWRKVISGVFFIVTILLFFILLTPTQRNDIFVYQEKNYQKLENEAERFVEDYSKEFKENEIINGSFTKFEKQFRVDKNKSSPRVTVVFEDGKTSINRDEDEFEFFFSIVFALIVLLIIFFVVSSAISYILYIFVIPISFIKWIIAKKTAKKAQD